MVGATDGAERVMVGRILSDDVAGDIPGRRFGIAGEILDRTRSEWPASAMRSVWVLNRVRDPELRRRLRELLQVQGEGEPAGEPATLLRSGLPRTDVLELRFGLDELVRCGDRHAALRYLANPNEARNAILAHGAAQGMRYTFVLDGDIYVPPETFRQVSALTGDWTADDPVWLFTARAASLTAFEEANPPHGQPLEATDTCESRFVLNSWPPRVISLGDEGMLGLPSPGPWFDVGREYGNDTKVAFCERLKAAARRLIFASYPVCHLEHRVLPDLLPGLTSAEREAALLDHRMAMRRNALETMLDIWRGCRLAT